MPPRKSVTSRCGYDKSQIQRVGKSPNVTWCWHFQVIKFPMLIHFGGIKTTHMAVWWIWRISLSALFGLVSRDWGNTWKQSYPTFGPTPWSTGIMDKNAGKIQKKGTLQGKHMNQSQLKLLISWLKLLFYYYFCLDFNTIWSHFFPRLLV